MKVVRNYYDLSQAERESNMRTLEEGGTWEVPEGDISEEQMKQEIAAMVKQSDESAKDSNFVEDEARKERFDLMSRSALLLAKYLNLNIEIDTDNKKHSTIELSGGPILLLKEMGKTVREIMAVLFSSADEAWVDGNGIGVRLVFFFEVNRKVPAAGEHPAG